MPKSFRLLFDHNAMLEARINAGFSIGDVVRKTGLARAGIVAAEDPRRETPVNGKMLDALAALYGVDPKDLIRTKHGGTKKIPPKPKHGRNTKIPPELLRR